MSNQRSTVVGVFDERSEAERAVAEMQQMGFHHDQIGLAARDGAAQDGTLSETGGEHTGSHTAAGILGGASLGAVVGALATGLIPGVGPIIAGGLLAGILGGAAVGAAAGGMMGALTGMGVPEEDARYYDREFQGGRTIVTVRAADRFDEAQAVLRRYGAYDVTSEPSGRAGGYASPTMGTGASRDEQSDGGQRMQLREEELTARKESVQSGEVQVRKEVITENRTLDVPVTREEVHVERTPIERRPSDRSFDDVTEKTISIPVREERVTVEKQAVVTEEVGVGKRAVEETQHVSGTVRREEALIEEEGDGRTRGAGSGAQIFEKKQEGY